MSFPFDWSRKELVEADLDLFSPEFAEIVTLFLPCRQVRFAGPHHGGELSPAWKAGVEMVRNEQKPVVDGGEEEHLYLPLWAGASLFGVAVLDNPPATYQDSSAVLLLEKSRLISAEMARIKQYALDPVTGLPTGRLLARRLQALLPAGGDTRNNGAPFSLLLVEMHPRARDGEQALAVIARGGAFLDSLIGHLFTPCHLGNGIFGLLWDGLAVEQTMKMAEMLLRWLKREGFIRSRIGIRSFSPNETMVSVEQFLGQSWEALGIARRRGPSALCSYQAVSDRSAHPLCPLPPKILSRLRKRWMESSRFALVLLHADRPGADLPALPAALAAPRVELNGREAFVYLDGADREAAETWCRDFRARTAGSAGFSMGIAVYPQHGFKKAELPVNCRKALLHTGFFGPNSMTVFDGVSLNISGDIYYNDGDLARAAKEYRLGLQLDPENINLLNSLGVTLAQMNLYRKAIPLFQRALTLDPANFMALFNLGFAYLASGEEAQALENLEKALGIQEDNFDLLLQLGKLYCKSGRYDEAVKVLGKGEQVGPAGVRDISHGAVHRFLGEAYKELGENGKAMICLQKATRHNPRDGAALSLLGELYFQEKQGGEIALALCRQAVELDERDWRNWSRLCSVLMGLENYEEALRAVRRGLGLASRNSRLLFQLAALYEKRGRKALAIKMFRKVLRLDPQCAEAGQRLAAYGQA
ncbi:MAG: tetratricopeptide repeat protein [Deltaproteobacteria bacterium]|nr:tetratricopeptide repeat protein [Deltaproteobacteria bacterium]